MTDIAATSLSFQGQLTFLSLTGFVAKVKCRSAKLTFFGVKNAPLVGNSGNFSQIRWEHQVLRREGKRKVLRPLGVSRERKKKGREEGTSNM